MKRTFWIIVIIGVAIRIFLSLTTFHSDMLVFELAGKLVASGNILNLYDFTSNSAVFNYPPAIYLFHGLFNYLFNILGLSQITQLNLNLLLLKLPYFIFDFLIGVILFKLFDSPKKSLLAFTLWIFNPISLYATYMMGQFDIIPTFFIILSIYFAIKGKLERAALALGGGIAFKLFPVFLVIPLIVLSKNSLDRLKLLILATLPYLLLTLPYLSSSSFRATALFANQSSKSLYAVIPVSGGESIILFPAVLLLFYFIIWSFQHKTEIWRLYSIPLLLFFIFTHFHPQWLIWITPLLILGLTSTGFRSLPLYILIFISWFFSLFFFDPSLTIGIFSPLVPALNNTPSIWMILGINVDYNLSRSLIQTIFVSSAIYLIYQYFPRKTDV
ncbi:hypothetical protein HYU45_02410 [Candidatus Daviesbacteria bacterium]|nr:hypothetical protein [Candidatus Daviesbacteria bacterium]